MEQNLTEIRYDFDNSKVTTADNINVLYTENKVSG